MTQEIKLGLVGYGTYTEEGGRGSGMLKQAASLFEGVRAVGICDTNPRALIRRARLFPPRSTLTTLTPCSRKFPWTPY